jgi:hypothetical protein
MNKMYHNQRNAFVGYLYIMDLINARKMKHINPLKAELNPIRHLLALAVAHHFVDVSRIRVKIVLVNICA